MALLKRLVRFVRYNRNKRLSIHAYFLSAWYRFCVLFLPMRAIEKHFGVRGQESSYIITEKEIKYCIRISYVANRICNQTKWQSKCLVRALVAQTLLYRKKVKTTMYLGVRKENGGLIAHAWLRAGDFYVTGGDGKDYVMVAKFVK